MRNLDPRRINELLLEVARGASLATLMRKRGFSRADFRRWQDLYGMPVVHEPLTARQLAGLKAWRREPTRARMWNRYRRAAASLEEGEVPAFDGPRVDRYERVELKAWVHAPRILLVCEKSATTSALEDWLPPRGSFSYRHRAALATTPWLPSRAAVDALLGRARRVPVAWFGDLDPQALHGFAALRAGGRQELLTSPRARRRIAYLGLDSTWLAWLERQSSDLRRFTITMRDADREYWAIVQRLVPDARRLIGAGASELLDSGRKIEVDGLIVQHRASFLRELGRRLRAVSARASTRSFVRVPRAP